MARAVALAALVSAAPAWAQPPPAAGASPRSQATETHITAKSGVHARREAQSFGVPRFVWFGAAAAMFLFIAGAVGANDRHRKREGQGPH